MIYRIFPTHDTFITSYRRNNVPQTGSNFGSSEILHLFKQAAVTSSLAPGLARILMKFDVDEIEDAFEDVTLSGSLQYRLRLRNAQHDKELPSSYSVKIQAVSQDWDEGRGHDTDTHRDRGVANWDKAKSNVWWTTAGAVGTGSIVYATFDQGHEDIDVDVTSIVSQWTSSQIPNYGFLIQLSGTHETDNNDYFVKMFHSRETFFPDKLPHLEGLGADANSATGSLTFISGSGAFYVNITNLKSEYERDEEVKLRLFIRHHDYNPAVVLTGSSSSTSLAVQEAYWRVTNDRTKAVVVPFGTGSRETQLDWDSSGNFFNFYMRNLPAGEVYRIAFLFELDEQRTLIDEGFKFRVV